MEEPDISTPQFPVVQTGHPTFENEVLVHSWHTGSERRPVIYGCADSLTLEERSVYLMRPQAPSAFVFN